MAFAAPITYNGDMKRFLIALLVVLLVACAPPARAQADAAPSIVPPLPAVPGAAVPLSGRAGEVSPVEQCFNVINNAPYGVMGSVMSDVYRTPEGDPARHRSNFNLKPGEQTRFCANGPYYEGGKLELVIRTLVPVFSCKTRIDGDIVISGRKKPDGGTDTWAVCR